MPPHTTLTATKSLEASGVLEGAVPRYSSTHEARGQEAHHWLADLSSSAESRAVLLAEDNDDLREVMQAFLEVMGYAVLPCRDAHMASKIFRSGARVDLLLTDIEMPGRSGVELARELTALSPSLPVLIVSGCFITAEMKAEMQARGWAFLSKPFAFPVLLATIHAVLGSSKELAA